MGKRYTIGLIYTINENWIAGTYYIENLISALKLLPSNEQPVLKIYCYKEEEFNELVKKTKYEHCQAVLLRDVDGVFDRIINKVSNKILKTHWRTGGTDNRVDIIFPDPSTYHFDRIKNKLFWIPDLQELHFPAFFSTSQIEGRTAKYKALVEKNCPIVFSSNHAKSDFIKLYPKARNQVFVMPFAVTLPDVDSIQVEALNDKYKLPDAYFICSNQFWAHKNHKVVLRALKYLKENGRNVVVVFTGKPFDNRNPTYYQELMTQVEMDGIQENVRFLGFISRIEQLVLMKNSIAIIQPSLFEGWSTVVEDGKALNQPIILSDIEVHREQLPQHELFFKPDNYQKLGSLMEMVLKTTRKNVYINYLEDIKTFGHTFMSIVDSLI